MNGKTLSEEISTNQDEENPEWTKQDFLRARPASEVHGHSIADALVRKRGRPPKAEKERKKQVTLRLSQDVLSAVRNSGSGWQSRIDDILRAAFIFNHELSMADLGAAIVRNAKGHNPRARSHVAPRQRNRRNPRDRSDQQKGA